MRVGIVAVGIFSGLLSVSVCGSKEAVTGTVHSANSDPAVTVARVGEALTEVSLLSEVQQQKADLVSTLLTISPALPAGLSFNANNARVSGVASDLVPPTDYTVSVHSDNVVTQYPVKLSVGPQLPGSIEFLASGFSAEKIVSNAKIPVRMAIAEDGRLFYAELQTGNIRIVDPQDGLLPSHW